MIAAQVMRELLLCQSFFEELLPMKWFSHFLYLYLQCH